MYIHFLSFKICPWLLKLSSNHSTVGPSAIIIINEVKSDPLIRISTFLIHQNGNKRQTIQMQQMFPHYWKYTRKKNVEAEEEEADRGEGVAGVGNQEAGLPDGAVADRHALYESRRAHPSRNKNRRNYPLSQIFSFEDLKPLPNPQTHLITHTQTNIAQSWEPTALSKNSNPPRLASGREKN